MFSDARAMGAERRGLLKSAVAPPNLCGSHAGSSFYMGTGVGFPPKKSQNGVVNPFRTLSSWLPSRKVLTWNSDLFEDNGSTVRRVAFLPPLVEAKVWVFFGCCRPLGPSLILGVLNFGLLGPKPTPLPAALGWLPELGPPSPEIEP